MNGRKTKQLRKEFLAWFGSTSIDGEMAKYYWRLFKKTRNRRGLR
jgi:hypothetical protein